MGFGIISLLDIDILRSGACPQTLPAQNCIAVGGLQAGNGMFYYTYVLTSKIDNGFYVGWTDNIDRRINKHNSGKVKSTKARRPFQLVYYEACRSKQKAIKREKQLKTGFGRKYIKRRI